MYNERCRKKIESVSKKRSPKWTEKETGKLVEKRTDLCHNY